MSRILIIGAAAIFAAALFAGWGPSVARAGDADGTLTVQIENDYFAGTDRHYTQGLRLSYLAPATRTPLWAQRLPDVPAWFGPGTDKRADRRIGVTVGQSIFTPQDVEAVNVVVNDRPYAGWLYGGLAMQTRYKDGEASTRLDILAIEFGIVGPYALAEETQNTFHGLIKSYRVNGWDNQLKNEPAFHVTFERKWRTGEVHLISWRDRVDLAVDFIPHVSLSAGTVYTHAGFGGTIRLGNYLPDDFGPARIRPASPGSQSFDPIGDPRGLRWYLFLGLEGRAVARDIFLDGNTFASSHSVDKKPLVADLQLGLALVLGDDVRVNYTYVVRSREFRGQLKPDRFGAMSLSVRF